MTILLPVAAQCRLLKVARSTLYYQPVPARPDDLAVMRRIDELHLEYPFYGSHRTAAVLRNDGWVVNRKRAQMLMRMMGLEAIYLVAVKGWSSRRVLACRLSITMETDCCNDALHEAMDRYGRPEIFNTVQGVQFPSAAFLDELSSQGVWISIDGKT
jgi:putative transposase